MQNLSNSSTTRCITLRPAAFKLHNASSEIRSPLDLQMLLRSNRGEESSQRRKTLIPKENSARVCLFLLTKPLQGTWVNLFSDLILDECKFPFQAKVCLEKSRSIKCKSSGNERVNLFHPSRAAVCVANFAMRCINYQQGNKRSSEFALRQAKILRALSHT